MPDVAEPQPQEHWTLDRRVPLALLMAIIIQTAVMGAAWGTMTTTVASLTGRVERVEQAIAQQSTMRDDVVGLKVRMDAVTNGQTRIEAKLDILQDGQTRSARR